eukprot:UN22119
MVVLSHQFWNLSSSLLQFSFNRILFFSICLFEFCLLNLRFSRQQACLFLIPVAP